MLMIFKKNNTKFKMKKIILRADLVGVYYVEKQLIIIAKKKDNQYVLICAN